MPTLEQVKTQISSINGVEKFLAGKEVKQLPNILWEDELIEKFTSGTYNNGHGILVATNKRLIFVDKGMIFGLRVEDFPYDKITSIQYKTGLLFGEITIYASGNNAVINNMNKQQTKDFATYVRARISEVVKHAGAPKSDSEDVITQLERLGKLQDQGILSEMEFTEQKNKILNR